MLKAPFPWFGGKSRVSHLVWQRFGADVSNYVEPFAGSLACLLQRPPQKIGIKTVNDRDCLLSNFWRSLQADPELTAYWANWPVNEADLHARHYWLVCQKERMAERLQADPDFYDAKVAGWWVWGICAWIGGEWCTGNGAWKSDGKRLVKGKPGCDRSIPQMGNAGRGINRQQVTADYFERLADRLRRVRVCCGDWPRVLTPTLTEKLGITGVFLDPPYDQFGHLYNCNEVFTEVANWAIANGGNPKLRIALCGYDGSFEMPEGWSEVSWRGIGYGAGKGNKADANRHKERIWFSPHCLQPERQLSLLLT